MRHYTRQDCDQTGSDCSLNDRVVVLSESALPDGIRISFFSVPERMA